MLQKLVWKGCSHILPWVRCPKTYNAKGAQSNNRNHMCCAQMFIHFGGAWIHTVQHFTTCANDCSGTLSQASTPRTGMKSSPGHYFQKCCTDNHLLTKIKKHYPEMSHHIPRACNGQTTADKPRFLSKSLCFFFIGSKGKEALCCSISVWKVSSTRCFPCTSPPYQGQSPGFYLH